MYMIARAGLTTCFLLGGLAAAQAQPVQNWTGFYVGAHAGYAWGTSDAVTAVGSNGTYFTGNDPELVAASGHGALRPSGGVGGVQAGFNWRYGNVVFGGEVDLSALSLSASRSITTAYQTLPGTFFTINQSVGTNWLITARPRLGWANENWLVYVTGGLAVTKLDYDNSYSDTSAFAGSENGSVSKTKVGYALGGGAEYAFSGRWSIKAEYLYVNFGDVSSTGTVTTNGGFTATLIHTADLSAHIARVGINYRFSGL